jgi:Concanavalin A-like lectin/glucanases superfamily
MSCGLMTAAAMGRGYMSKWLRRAASTAAFSVVAGMTLVPAVAASAATNLLPNGTFDGGTTSGWKGTNATLSVVSPGYGGTGDAAKVALSKSATSYSMYAQPKPATNVAQGSQLQGTAEVLGVTGKNTCLLLQEVKPAGGVVQTAKQCVKATGSWQAIGPVTLTDKTAGDSVGFMIQQTGAVTGNSFEADSLSLTESSSTSGTVAAQWNMNETSGTTMYDSSGNNNNGTLQGPVQLGVAGPSGQGTAYGFSGKSDVDVPYSATLVAGSANIDIAFWLKTTNLPTSGDYDLVRMGDYPAQEYKVELEKNNQIACTYHGSSSSNNATGGANVANGQWHYVQCIKTATAIQVVIDGTTVANKSAMIGSVSPPSDLYVGAHGSPGTAAGFDWYQGDLDDVSVTFG